MEAAAAAWALGAALATARARSVAAVAALVVIVIGAAPMASAAANRNADPILALAIAGNSTTLNLPAPGFSLTDQNGQTVSLASLRGKVVLMTFLDPVCTTDCPIIAQEFKQTGQLLGAQNKNVELVAIVANPTYRSTVFTRAFDQQEGMATVPNWLYLTGSLSQLSAVWQHYGITVENLPGGRDVRAQRASRRHRPIRRDPPGAERRPRARPPAAPSPRSPCCSASTPAKPWAARDPRTDPGDPGDSGRPGRILRGPARGLRVAAGRGDQPRQPPAVTVPLSTSLVTAQGTWAVAVMGGSAASHNNFWQLFVRPAGASRWSLVTPQGVADNGGLVAAGASTSLIVGFRPSQNLTYSPLATSTDTGKNWTPGLLDADLADTPGAIAISPSGRTLALLQDGTITTAPTASAAAAGQWTPLTTLKALAASAPGRSCGLMGVSAVSFGPGNNPMAAGSCARPGVAGVFTDSGGTWRSAGLVLAEKGAGIGTVQVLGLAATAGGNVALLAAGNSLLAAWWNGTRWTVSDPLAAGPDGEHRAGARVRRRRERVAAARRRARGDHRRRRRLVAGAAAVAVRHHGARAAGHRDARALRYRLGGRSYDALAVSGAKLTVWRLASGSLGEGPADHRADRVRLLGLGGP